MADLFDAVTVRHPETGETREVFRGSLAGFVNQGFEVLDAAGRKKAQQPTPASEKKEN